LSLTSPLVADALGGFGFTFYFGRLLYAHSGDAVAFQLFDGVAATFVFETVAHIWDSLQAGEDESRQRFEPCITRQCQSVFGFEVADIHRAFEHHHRFIFQRWFAGRDVEFIFYIADQLLEDVFDRDHARGRAKLVDHDREMTPTLFEFGEQFRQNLGLGNYDHVVHDLPDLHASDARGGGLPEVAQAQSHPAHKGIIVENADDVFRAALRVVERGAGVWASDQLGKCIIELKV